MIWNGYKHTDMFLYGLTKSVLSYSKYITKLHLWCDYYSILILLLYVNGELLGSSKQSQNIDYEEDQQLKLKKLYIETLCNGLGVV